MTATKRKMIAIAFAVGLGCFLPVLLLSPFLERFERNTLDMRFLWLSDPAEASDDIVIVTIDQKTLNFFKEKKNTFYPFPRDFYALALRFLKRAQPKAVGIDMVFSEPDIDRLETDGAETDGFFAMAMKELGCVYLVSLLWQQGGTPPDEEQWKLLAPSQMESGGHVALEGSGATLPIPLLMEAAAGIGFVNVKQDSDGVVRAMPLQFSLDGRTFGLLGYKMAVDNNLVKEGGLPLDDRGLLPLRFYGAGGTGPKASYKSISFFALAQSEINMMQNKEPLIDPAEFKDKWIFIGATAPGLLDFKTTPFSSIEPYPGVELHATMLNNILNDEFLTLTPDWVTLTMALLLALVVAFAFFLSESYKVSSLLALLLLVGHQALALGLFSASRVWLPVVVPAAALVTAFMASALVKYMLVGRSRAALRSAFSRYLSAEVVTQIVTSESPPSLGGADIEATVFFSDIAAFTTISEAMTPRDVIALLNDYHSEMSDIVLKYGGMVDKFIGDGMMCIFHAPYHHPDHALNACLASLEIHKKLDEIRPELEEKYGQVVTARVGLDTGHIVVGNMGSSTRLEYTAIGDTVNSAARLEAGGKMYGTRILVGEDTAWAVEGRIICREVDRLLIKGKTKPKAIFEVVCTPEDLNDDLQKILDDFHRARELYLEKKFEEAAAIFGSHADDPVSVTYEKRCKNLIGVELPDPWDGVFEQKSK